MTNSGERRSKASRLKVFLRASILVDGDVLLDCVVIDLSESGARLSVHTADEIPKIFTLHIPARKLIRSCQLIHRLQDDAVGVKFIEKRSW
jgi:hypothetical protein